ncbi:MAG: HEAT repeat domain-containing protein [Kiritimatiellaeota bacterium]|nr:HEAT repeat domain-containing protein [Kiritimatiellota bacterium]
MFDGLDEVPDMQARWTASRSIESCLRACAEKGSNGSRCMVTSRKYGYELCRLHDCPHWELAAFGPQQIEKFIHGWCRALEKSLHPDAPQIAGAEQEARELAAAINDPGSVHHDSLQGFVQNPLLLTIVALVRWQYRILPERRARLYELALTTLIETWNRMRSLNGRIEGVELDARETMELWEPVALWMHRQYPGGTAHRSEILAQLAGKLAQDGIPRDAAIQTAESYLDSAARWAGLLVERGPNAFGFVHQTFQEYLSARALVRSAQNPYEQLKTYVLDPRWHEIILLAAGFLGEVQGRSEDCTALVERIRDTTDALEPMLHRYLLLAADVVADRAPVSLRCHGETLLRLMEKCPAAVHDAKLANSFRNTIASLCWLEPDDRILKKAKALLQKEESLSWKSRAALMLLGSRMPAKAVGLLNLGLKDSDTDVRGLAAALMLRAASSSVREFASLLKPRWYETGARVLDRKAEQILLESLAMPEVVQYFVELLKDKESEVRVRAAAALQAVRPLSEAAQSGLVELLKDKESEVRARAAAALARALAELLKQGSEPPAWLATRTHISVARSAVPPILAGDAKPASLRELLERALTGSNSEKEAACQDLGRQLGAGSASFPPTVAELLSELQDRRFSEGLGSAGPTETKLRNLLAVALRTRLHDLARRSRASGVSSARSDAAFLQALPAALLPQVVDGELEELSDELKKAALSRLVEQDFDRLAPELQRVVLGLYDRLRTLAGPAEMQRILRRISRAYDADEAETRAYACRSLAVFLPDLNAKERRRCFEQLLEAARGDDQEMKEAAVESLLMIQGHLSKPERASVQEARLV